MDLKITPILLLAFLLTACTKDHPLQKSELISFNSRANAKVKAPATHNEIEILESNSDFVNEIRLVSPAVMSLGTDDDWGTIFLLPPVSQGTELIFEITPTLMGSPTGDGPWQTGPGSRNPDGKKHAVVNKLPDKSSIVNFEDIDASGWGTADEPNFLDAIFHVRPATP